MLLALLPVPFHAVGHVPPKHDLLNPGIPSRMVLVPLSQHPGACGSEDTLVHVDSGGPSFSGALLVEAWKAPAGEGELGEELREADCFFSD